jgi:hypothetical protein
MPELVTTTPTTHGLLVGNCVDGAYRAVAGLHHDWFSHCELAGA